MKIFVYRFIVRSAILIDNIEIGIVKINTTTSKGTFSITGTISLSYPAGISSTAATNDPAVSVHQCMVYAKFFRIFAKKYLT